jgi:hypothetical protein
MGRRGESVLAVKPAEQRTVSAPYFPWGGGPLHIRRPAETNLSINSGAHGESRCLIDRNLGIGIAPATEMRAIGPIAIISLLAAAGPASIAAPQAQSPLDRVVGPAGQPYVFATGQTRLLLRRIDAATIGALGAAARVPMGFESAPFFDAALPAITATGRRLLDVLQDIVAADPRYEWREDDGVIVLRPRVSWEVLDPLDTPVDALKLNDINSGDAMHVLAAMVGTTSTGSISGDTVRFSIDTPAGSTFLQVLNAIVRAHGRLTWTLYYGDLPRHTGVFLGLSAGTGGGFGIPPGGYVRSIETTEWFPRFNSTVPLLDRIVGPAKRGEPLAVNSVHDLAALAEAIGSPTGLELLPPKVRESFVAPDRLPITGLPVRDALVVLASRDPGYEARELDGVLVLRPSASWSDSAHPLLRPVKSVRLQNATVGQAIGMITSLLGRKEPIGPMLDSRRFSVVLTRGSILDLLNAVAKAHGGLSWMWEEHSARERKETGCRYALNVAMFGTGGYQGFFIP